MAGALPTKRTIMEAFPIYAYEIVVEFREACYKPAIRTEILYNAYGRGGGEGLRVSRVCVGACACVCVGVCVWECVQFTLLLGCALQRAQVLCFYGSAWRRNILLGAKYMRPTTIRRSILLTRYSCK